MFFQQTHNARNAVDEADENVMGSHYPETPPWALSGSKRLSTVSNMSSSYRLTTASSPGADQMSRSRSGSSISAQPIRDPNRLHRGPGIYLRQASSSRSSTGQTRANFARAKPSGNPAWRFIKRVMSSSFGLFLVIQTYLCIGAFCFMWMEAATEEEQRAKMDSLRSSVANNLSECTGNVTCHEEILKEWESLLVQFPPIFIEIETGQVWSWIYSYYCSFTIISTIGYGNLTPLSTVGRMFAIVYAVIGIPLMLLFITDTGNKLARLTKIAIIAFRKWKYTLCLRCRRSKEKINDTEAKEVEQENEQYEVREATEGTAEGTVRKDDLYNKLRVPEVHINIAMSTLDEQTCEVEDSGGTREDKLRLHGYGKEETNDRSLNVGDGNSEYGGSSTGMDACCSDTPENAHKIVPNVSEGDVNLAKLALESPSLTKTSDNTRLEGVTVNSTTPTDGEMLDSVFQPGSHNSDSVSGRSDVDFVSNVKNADFLLPENATIPALEFEEITVVVDRTLGNEDTVRTVHIDDGKTEIGQCEPNEVSHASPFRQKTAVDARIREHCGQHLQTSPVQNFTPDNTGTTQSERHDNRKRKRRKGTITESIPEYTEYNSSKQKQNSGCTHKKLSRNTSKSLENISVPQRDDTREPDMAQRSAVRTNSDRRTSAPCVVSFQTKPVKQNGSLPNRCRERIRSDSSDLENAGRDTDYDGEFRDRNPTDSGVASSSSNSTECSPKRQLNSVNPNIEEDNLDSVFVDRYGCHDDDIDVDDVSDDDVMDSEEERKLGRLRQSSGMGRLDTVNKLLRISEADIAMLSIPLWLAFLLLLIYLLIGAACFTAMKQWTFLDGFYYCFITLSTIGFGDFVFLPQNVHTGLIFSFLYSFLGLCFTSMCMSLSSMELTLLSRKISKKFGVYSGRIRHMSSVRWASRRRKTIRATSPDAR